MEPLTCSALDVDVLWLTLAEIQHLTFRLGETEAARLRAGVSHQAFELLPKMNSSSDLMTFIFGDIFK